MLTKAGNISNERASSEQDASQLVMRQFARWRALQTLAFCAAAGAVGAGANSHSSAIRASFAEVHAALMYIHRESARANSHASAIHASFAVHTATAGTAGKEASSYSSCETSGQ